MIARPFATTESRTQLAVLITALVWLSALALALQGGLIGDEWVHYHQISRFLAGNTSVMREYLTTLPGFHWTITAVLHLAGADSLGAARVVNVGFGLASVLVFHRLRIELYPDDVPRATSQFALLPVLLPFVFLVYTDVLSLLLVMSGLLMSLRRWHLMAAALLLASMTVRQNNVVWVAACATLAGNASWRDAQLSLRNRLHALMGLWPYLVAIAAFLLYWLGHGSISYSSSQAPMHPDLKLNVGNPFFLLLLVAMLLPLQVCEGLGRFFNDARAQPWRWLLPLSTAAVYLIWFRVDHPYNLIVPEQNIRNALLVFASEHLWAWAALGLIATLSICGLSAMRWARPDVWLLLPFVLLFLAASWLIEPRYSLIPLMLLLVLRVPSSAWIERLTWALWAILAVYLMLGIFDHRLMI